MGIKVTLRKKTISKNRFSYYLDFYPPVENPKNGKETRRQFLGLYIYQNPKTPTEKMHNSNTTALAKEIERTRHNELNKPEIYSEFEKERLAQMQKEEEDFVTYFKKLADERKSSNHDNWISAYKYLLLYTGGSAKFKTVDQTFCEGFKNFLLTTKSRKSEKVKLANGSAVSYFNKFKATLKQSYKDGYLRHDINSKVECIPTEETHRDFLTLEELNALVKTPCNNIPLKKAAIFSALTGLRFSDIQKLTWQELRYDPDHGYSIAFKQRKTKGAEVLPISDQAAGLLGERQKPDNRVIDGLTYSAYHNKYLFQWIGAAGITKNITFHCFRHTYAVLQLANGTDIYTVSKLLGHKDLKTTQIYAKVVDRAKREAADKIKLDL